MAYDNIDYTADHYCPAYGRVVSVDLCYDSLCCLTGQFKTYSTRELAGNRRYGGRKENMQGMQIQ